MNHGHVLLFMPHAATCIGFSKTCFSLASRLSIQHAAATCHLSSLETQWRIT